MKIRPQLVLVEVILSIVLLVGVLFSISSFVSFMAYEELAIKTARLKDTTSDTRFSLLAMSTMNEQASFLINDYVLLSDQLTIDLEAIVNDSEYERLPQETRRQFTIISDGWDLARRTTDLGDIEEHLALRELADTGNPESLASLRTIMRNDPDTPYVTLKTVEDAFRNVKLQEERFVTFELMVDQVLDSVVETIEIYRIERFAAALVVPLLILVAAFIGVVLFSGRLSRKLNKLDRALVDIGGGDFSVRVDIRGRDEFNSLATSVNAFTRTLGAKLESFRLMMHEIGQTLTADTESTQVEESLVALAIRDTSADGAALYKVAGEEGQLILSVVQGRYRPPYEVIDLPEEPEEEDILAILRSRIIQPGRTVIGESAVQGESRLIRDVASRPELGWPRQPGDSLFLASVIVVPLRVGSVVNGVLVVTSSRPDRLFSDLEYANMQSFGELAAITLDNIYKYADLLEATQLSRELGIAEEIQQDLLPKRLPRLPSGDVAYLSRSIKGLNGDYFDVYPLGDGKTMVTICEVAGRGVPAGLVMVMIRTILRLIASPEMDARDIMMRLNQDMTRRIAIENYASVGILIIDSDGSYTFSSAAHYPLQILRSGSEQYESIQTEGIPVGIDRDASYLQETGNLGANDILLFHTDGIPESRNRNGEIFGMDRLLETVSGFAEQSPEAIVENLRTELEYFERGTDQKDDQTVIVLKYTGGDAA